MLKTALEQTLKPNTAPIGGISRKDGEFKERMERGTGHKMCMGDADSD